MRVLAIDTALAACSAAVLDTAVGGIVASESLPMLRGHAEALMPLIARVMDQAGMAFADLDRVVVTTGPGSFTGLRVGIAAARGIALAIDKPAVGVSTLSAYAAPYLAEMKSAGRRRYRCAARPRLSAGVRRRAAAPSPRRGLPRCAKQCARRPEAPPASSVRQRKLVAAGLPRPTLRRCASTPPARPTSTGWRGWAPRCRKDSRRRSRNICARPTRSRKMPRNCRADDRLLSRLFGRAAAHFLRSAAARCRSDRRPARRFVPARLGRGRSLSAADRKDASSPIAP